MGTSTVFSHLVENESTPSGQQVDMEKGETMLDVTTALLEVSVKEFSLDVPFTAYGLDSISAAKMSFFLRPFVDVSQLQLLSDMTFHDLTKRLKDRESSESHITTPFPTGEFSSPDITAVDDMKAMIAKYSSNFQNHVNVRSSARSEETVILTGSTGALGTSVLVQLIEMPTVTRIYAVNRPDPRGSISLEDRQAASLRRRGYDAAILQSHKVVWVEGRLEIPGFGIAQETFDEVRESMRSM